MKNRLLTLFLLFSINFNISHAYVIEALDTHPCQVGEYVHEFHDNNNIEADDICNIHHLFHIAFILPETDISIVHEHFTTRPSTEIKQHKYNSHKNFLKPPINA